MSWKFSASEHPTDPTLSTLKLTLMHGVHIMFKGGAKIYVVSRNKVILKSVAEEPLSAVLFRMCDKTAHLRMIARDISIVSPPIILPIPSFLLLFTFLLRSRDKGVFLQTVSDPLGQDLPM
jgi:hypothetical protein